VSAPFVRIEEALRSHGCEPKDGRARCPCAEHGQGRGDVNPSLTYGHRSDGRAWVKCHAGCPRSAVLESLALAAADLKPAASSMVATYPYVDEQGKLLFEVVRFHPKRFRQRRPDGRGGHTWSIRGVRRVLYRLPQVLVAVKDGQTIYVVEGEKDVHAAEKQGLIATTNPGGAEKWRGEYSGSLRGAHVVLVADRDRRGIQHVHEIARSLLDVAASVQIVRAADGKDLYDHFAAGRTVDELVPQEDDDEPTQEEHRPLTDTGNAERQRREDVGRVREIRREDVGLDAADTIREVEPTLAVPWPERPPPEAFHGLAGDFVRLVEPHTEADPLALLVQFHTYFGNALGRSPFYRVEADDHHANLNVLLVGRTAKGRKGVSEGHARAAFAGVDDEWLQNRVVSGLSSGEGLIWQVRDPITKRQKARTSGGSSPCTYEDTVIDPGEEDKRLVVVEAEFAGTLRVLQRDGNTLSPVLRSAWDGHEVLQALTKNNPAKATGAHISIIGHITKDELLRYLDRTELANGFMNRFLVVCVQRSKELPEGGNIDPKALRSLSQQLVATVAAGRSFGRVTFDPAARELWHAAYSALSAERPGIFGAVTGRAEAQCARLAMIYALEDGSSVIRVEHMRAAFGLWSYCEASARFVFGDALGDPVADEILRALRRTPEGLARTAIRDLFSRNKSGSDIARALGVLLQHGLARPVSVPTGGRPAETWRATTETTDTTKGGRGEGLRSFRSFLSSLPAVASGPVPTCPEPADDAVPESVAIEAATEPGSAEVRQGESLFPADGPGPGTRPVRGGGEDPTDDHGCVGPMEASV